MTIGFVDAHRNRFAVAAMCRVLEFAECTFYAAKVRSVCARALGDIDRKTAISVEWKANYSCFGARRLHKHLRRHGHTIARCTVARLMRDLGIHGVQRGRKQFTNHADKTADRPPDLVKRDFTATAPNEWRRDPAGDCVHHSDAGSPVHVDPLHRPPRHSRHRSFRGHRW